MLCGHVHALWRYPVKSMAAEPLERAEIGWHGISGDRRWAFVRAAQVRNGFPWLTIREKPTLWRYQPRLVDGARPDKTDVQVRTPAGDELEVCDPALAAQLGAGVRAMKLDRGTFDTATLSLITRQTLAGLGGLVGRELAAPRFRPNILIDAAGDFPEDAWVGRVLRIGSLRVRVDKRDQRCVLVNIDPVTCARDPAVLKTIGRAREACLGVYGSVVAPGALAVGDPVMLDA